MDFSSTVYEIASKQGWSDETLGEIMLGFLRDEVAESVRGHFITRLLEIQREENADNEDGDEEDSDEGDDEWRNWADNYVGPTFREFDDDTPNA